MNKLLSFSDVMLKIKRFINDMNIYAYATILVTLSILLIAIFKYILKHAYNKNTKIKINLAKPIISSILVFILLAFLIIARSQ